MQLLILHVFIPLASAATKSTQNNTTETFSNVLLGTIGVFIVLMIVFGIRFASARQALNEFDAKYKIQPEKQKNGKPSARKRLKHELQIAEAMWILGVLLILLGYAVDFIIPYGISLIVGFILIGAGYMKQNKESALLQAYDDRHPDEVAKESAHLEKLTKPQLEQRTKLSLRFALLHKLFWVATGIGFLIIMVWLNTALRNHLVSVAS
jgi:hypothetical protein